MLDFDLERMHKYEKDIRLEKVAGSAAGVFTLASAAGGLCCAVT